MQETTLDLRAKTLIASFTALLGVLSLGALISVGQAQVNSGLQQLLLQDSE